MSFAHLTLAVSDLDRSLEFFRDTLGWQQIDHPSNAPVNGVWLRMGPGQELHLNEVANYEPPRHEDEFGRHVAVEFPATGFEALKTRLVARGAELIAPRRETPFERFFFRDPNGYLFEVVDANRAVD